jgi:hypothetical protein
MTTKSILELAGTTGTPPAWLRIPDAIRYSGLGKSVLYEELTANRIRSASIKRSPGAKRGVRLVERESLDRFIEDHITTL